MKGRLTDGQGRTVDFRNVLIIMTSNLGADYLVMQPEGTDSSAVREEVMNAVRAHFRPEFLNRVDEIILFHRLKREDMGAIVDIQLARLAKLLEDRKITLDLSAAARSWLADKGYDPAYGARPLKRVIQKAVQDPLAERLLAGTVRDGAEVHDRRRAGRADHRRRAGLRRGAARGGIARAALIDRKDRARQGPVFRPGATAHHLVVATLLRCWGCGCFGSAGLLRSEVQRAWNP